jgi:hypothetical protein
MTEFEKNCYGISQAQIRKEYMDGITAKLSGLEMVAMGILSDAQEMMVAGFDQDRVRKQINIAKFILCEIMEAKETA